MMQLLVPLLLLLLLSVAASRAAAASESLANILDYGAVPRTADARTAFGNSRALAAAFAAVSLQPPPRRVLVPAADFYAYNTTLHGVEDTTLQVAGRAGRKREGERNV